MVDGGSPVWLVVQLAALLGCALVLGRVVARFGMPAVIGELLTGILLGPSVLGALAPEVERWLLPPDPGARRLLDQFGLLGMVLFVGLVGMELDLAGLRRRRSSLLRVGACGLLLPFALGVLAGLGTPVELLVEESDRTVFSLFLGVALAVSAIPVIAKILTDLRLLHRDVSQLILGVAVIDDAVGWCLLGAVSAFAIHGLDAGRAVTTLLQLGLFVLLALACRRPLDRLLTALAGSRPVAAAALALVVVLGSAALAHALSLEAVFGAFVGGLLVRAATALPTLRPARRLTLAVLAPVAFAIAGLRVELRLLTDPVVVVSGLALLALAILGKFVGAYLGARLSGLTSWEGVALGAGLNARGMIQVIVATAGMRVGILTESMYTLLVLVAITTSVMTAPTLRWAMRRIETTPTEREREALPGP